MFKKFKEMGSKHSKGIGKNERTEIIQQVRTTINRSTTSNERSNLANQFQRASNINPDDLLTPLMKKHKAFVTCVKQSELVPVIKILTGGKIGINEVLDPISKITPLHVAAMLKKTEILNSMLHSTEIEVNALTRDGDTPLLLALKACGSSADEQDACLHTVNLLVEDRRCQIGRVNAVGATPLSVAVAKDMRAIVQALVAFNRIRVYAAIDLAMAIKLAFIYNRDHLVDVIFNEMDGDSKQGFVSLLEQNSDLKSLARHLQELDTKRADGSSVPSPAPATPKQKSPAPQPFYGQGFGSPRSPLAPGPPPSRENILGPAGIYSPQRPESLEDDVEDSAFNNNHNTLTPTSSSSFSPDNNNNNNSLGSQPTPSPSPKITISTSAVSLAQKSARDMNGKPIQIGNVVQVGSAATIRRLNPRIASEKDFVEGIAEKRAYVYDIDVEDDIYVGALDSGVGTASTPLTGHVTARSVKFVEVGPKTRLNDGLIVGVGYYVKVVDDLEEVRALAKGHGGWKEEMRHFCGHTGLIRTIDPAGDVFVHFPGGRQACFNPQALVGSSASGLEAKDVNGETIQKGSFARITKNLTEFRALQEEIGVDIGAGSDKKYRDIVGKLVKIRKLRLFLQYCDAIVLLDNQAYHINPRALRVVGSARDSEDVLLEVGDRVRVLSQKNVVRALQTAEYGDWVDKMDALLGKTGTVVDIDVNPSDTSPDSPVAKVQFAAQLGAYYLNPKIVQKQAEVDTSGGASSLSPKAVGVGGAGHSPSPSPRRSTQTSHGEDGGYGSASGLHNLGRDSSSSGPGGYGGCGGPEGASGHRKGSLASILSGDSCSSSYDGLQLIPRRDLEMKRKLGEGGFGCVTSGSWRGTDCAIKQIRPIVTSDIDYESILKEARIQYGLKHPNIVTLYGISYEQDLWMVMQLVDGMDLHSILFTRDRSGNKEKVAPGFKLKISVQTTNAISYLHEKGFIHNDIKPENIMIEKRTGNVLICDFGITRYLGKTDLRTYSQKYTSQFGGTLPYIAPECFQKDPVQRRYLRPTFKSDIWALAAVFIELFTEKELFPDEKSLYQCKIMKEYNGVKKILKEVADNTIRKLLTRGIDPDPDLRPTAEEMNGILFDIMRQK